MIRVAIKKFFAMHNAAGGLCRRLHLHAADVGNNLPDLFFRHADALPVGPVGGHDGARNSIADYLKHFRIRMYVLLLCPRQVRPAPTAVRPQSVAKRAIDAELRLTGFRGLGIVSIRILIVRSIGRSGREHQESGANGRHDTLPTLRLLNGRRHESPIRNLPAFYATGAKSSLWKSGKSRRRRADPQLYMSSGHLGPALLTLYT